MRFVLEITLTKKRSLILNCYFCMNFQEKANEFVLGVRDGHVMT